MVIAFSATGDKYYEHKLTQIEKGDLLTITSRLSNAEIASESPSLNIKDKRLSQILQVDETVKGSSDHKLSKIEKGKLLALPSRITNPVGANSSPFNINDKHLLQILQVDSISPTETHPKAALKPPLSVTVVSKPTTTPKSKAKPS